LPKKQGFWTGIARSRAFSKVWLDPPVDGCQRAYTTKAGKKKKEKENPGKSLKKN
jgi:hypothetical protein